MRVHAALCAPTAHRHVKRHVAHAAAAAAPVHRAASRMRYTAWHVATVAPCDGDRASVQRLERLSLADYDVLDPSDGSFDAEFAALQEQVGASLSVCRGACALNQVAHVLAHAGERSGGVHGSGACASLLHCSVRASGLTRIRPHWPKLVLRRGACKRLSPAGRCIPAAPGARLALTPSHKQVCVRALETRVTIGALISLIDAFAPFPAGPVAEAVPPLPVR